MQTRPVLGALAKLARARRPAGSRPAARSWGPGIVVLVLSLSVAWCSGAAAAGPPADYGDAPNGVDAYPPTLVPGHFPTCFGSADGYVVHLGGPLTVHFGHTVEYELDGNAGSCWSLPSDQDECQAPPDAGLIIPGAYMINGLGAIVTCSGAPGTVLGPACGTATWGGAPNPIDIDVVNGFAATMYVNVLVDWNQDGQWGGASPCDLGPAPEPVLVNFPIPPLFSGLLSLLSPPPFVIGPRDGYVWVRFNIAEVPVPANWNGAGIYDLGETEDYLLRIAPATADAPRVPGSAGSGLELEAGAPNPFRSRVQFAYTLSEASVVRLTVLDAGGRVVAHLGNAWQPAGRHPATWDGTSDDGRMLPAGNYFVRLQAGALVRTMKVARVR